MTTTITMIDVAKKAVELADANPEHVYQPETDGNGTTLGCRYVHHDPITEEPTGYGCIFGQALTSLGVTGIPENLHIGVVLRDLDISDEVSELHPLVMAQSRQDAKESWGVAIKPVKDFLAKQEVAA